MSKICDRNYAGNAMYTLKWIDGIGCCPSFNQPAICHRKPTEFRAMFWEINCDTGISSMAIARHMTASATEQPNGFMPPSDSGDRGRCIRLLELVPEWIARLGEMVKYDAPDKRQDTLVVNSSGISADQNTWAKQIPLILTEGKL